MEHPGESESARGRERARARTKREAASRGGAVAPRARSPGALPLLHFRPPTLALHVLCVGVREGGGGGGAGAARAAPIGRVFRGGLRLARVGKRAPPAPPPSPPPSPSRTCPSLPTSTTVRWVWWWAREWQAKQHPNTPPARTYRRAGSRRAPGAPRAPPRPTPPHGARSGCAASVGSGVERGIEGRERGERRGGGEEATTARCRAPPLATQRRAITNHPLPTPPHHTQASPPSPTPSSPPPASSPWRRRATNA